MLAALFWCQSNSSNKALQQLFMDGMPDQDSNKFPVSNRIAISRLMKPEQRAILINGMFNDKRTLEKRFPA